MTSREVLLSHRETIKEMLLRNCTWVAIAYEMTKLTGYKLNGGNTNKQIGRYFCIVKDKKKIIDVIIKDYVEVSVPSYRGYKTLHLFLSSKKRKGYCSVPDAGQCKFPMGEYPYVWCKDNAIEGNSYCNKHKSVCYKRLLCPT